MRLKPEIGSSEPHQNYSIISAIKGLGAFTKCICHCIIAVHLRASNSRWKTLKHLFKGREEPPFSLKGDHPTQYPPRRLSETSGYRGNLLLVAAPPVSGITRPATIAGLSNNKSRYFTKAGKGCPVSASQRVIPKYNLNNTVYEIRRILPPWFLNYSLNTPF